MATQYKAQPVPRKQNYSAAEIGLLVGCSGTTARGLMRDGTLPSFTLGKRIRVSHTALVEFATQHPEYGIQVPAGEEAGGEA